MITAALDEQAPIVQTCGETIAENARDALSSKVAALNQISGGAADGNHWMSLVKDNETVVECFTRTLDTISIQQVETRATQVRNASM